MKKIKKLSESSIEMECAIGVAFLIGMVAIVATPSLSSRGNKFVSSLSEAQQQAYKKIVGERWRIFLSASVAGLVAGFAAVYALQTSNNRVSGTASGCVFLATAFVVQYFWYMLSPKSDRMIRHLTRDQIQEWDSLGISYQRTYHFGLLLGLVGYFLLGNGMCKFF